MEIQAPDGATRMGAAYVPTILRSAFSPSLWVPTNLNALFTGSVKRRNASMRNARAG